MIADSIRCPICHEWIEMEPSPYPGAVSIRPCSCMVKDVDKGKRAGRESWNAHLDHLRGLGWPIPDGAYQSALPDDPYYW